jgi:lipopolysaccharide/colanic/teichoic acid biosynthesis glycosyltransferase
LVLNPSDSTTTILCDSILSNNYDIMTLSTTDNSSRQILSYLQRSAKNDLLVIDGLEEANCSKDILHEINKIRVQNNNVISIQDFIEYTLRRTYIKKIGCDWVASKDLIGIKISRHIELFKRIFDVFIILSFSPLIIFLIAFASIFIYISSPGPILYIQNRVGKNGRVFKLVKLRTMIHTFEANPHFTLENDIRIFPLGKILRLTKIDELPQAYNILMGHMSIIGPRPERVEIVKKLEAENSYYELRHLIKPGLTGWAQVNNPKANPTQNFEKLEYDLYYIKNANFLLDLEILLKTIYIVINLESL